MRNRKELEARIAQLKGENRQRKERLEKEWQGLGKSTARMKQSFNITRAVVSLLRGKKSKQKWIQALLPTLSSFLAGWLVKRKKSSS
jgi:hypothetical protein